MARRRANDIFSNIAGDTNQANVAGQIYSGSGQSEQLMAQIKQREQMARAQQGAAIGSAGSMALEKGGSMLAESLAEKGTEAAVEAGTGMIAEVATEGAADSIFGSAGTGGAGMVDTGVTMAAGMAGVDGTTAEIGGDAAGLAMATAAGGPIGAGVYAGSQLLTKGKFMGLNVGSIF